MIINYFITEVYCFIDDDDKKLVKKRFFCTLNSKKQRSCSPFDIYTTKELCVKSFFYKR